VKFGKAKRIVETCVKNFEVPTEKEGFSEVVTLYDEEDVRNYLKKWDCEKIELEEENQDENGADQDQNKFHKFPRTRHLINLGAATRDDLLVEKSQLKSYFSLPTNQSLDITEKVDGAQMGFSIDPKTFQIKVQNRSHYINSKSHKQFKNLDLWLNNHSSDLFEILEDSNKILFGEWMYAKHSIGYDSLPDYFLAFDLFDKVSGKFFSREYLEEKCSGTNISLVRVIYSTRDNSPERNDNLQITDKKSLLKLMDQKSIYGPEQIEGLYLKINSGQYVKDRCKIVREDFIAGNEHWSKGILTPNKLESYF